MTPNADYFFTIFLITILTTRFFLYFKPIPSPVIKGIRLHHYMYGLALIPIGLLFRNITMYAIGLGLFIDELSYLFLKGKNHKDNYSLLSLAGTAFFVVLIYILKEQLIRG